MTETPSNIALIGMPGSGKSTVGRLLAQELSRQFVDTDALIERAQGRTLQQIVDRGGDAALRRVEEAVLLDLHVRNRIIATGGSVVYCARGMAHLKAISTVVFLNVELNTLRARIHNWGSRGIAIRPEQSFEDLFGERFELYSRYADITLDCTELTAMEVCKNIIRATMK